MLSRQLENALRLFTDTDTDTVTDPRPYCPSSSIGLLQVSATDASSVAELLARADELMYVQKKGRPAP